MLLNNKWVNNEIKEENKKCLEKNENEHTSPNLWDTVKAVLRGKLIAIKAYLKKIEKPQIAALFTIAKCWRQPKSPPVKEWIKKKQLWYICTVEYHEAERKKELLPFRTAWMEPESIMLSEIREAVENKYHMISPMRGI